MPAELRHIGWVLLSKDTGEPVPTGPAGRAVAKLYRKQSRAHQVASNYGGKDWPERYEVKHVWVHIK